MVWCVKVYHPQKQERNVETRNKIIRACGFADSFVGNEERKHRWNKI